ncbi:hypothetical protein SERLADRAFT_460942, partial [Serpula lacrymans var. lacrymans S7.9]
MQSTRGISYVKRKKNTQTCKKIIPNISECLGINLRFFSNGRITAAEQVKIGKKKNCPDTSQRTRGYMR